MRCAIVDSKGHILNVIVADPAVDAAPQGCRLIAIPIGIGADHKNHWTVDGGVAFVPPDHYAVVDIPQEKIVEVMDRKANSATPSSSKGIVIKAPLYVTADFTYKNGTFVKPPVSQPSSAVVGSSTL